MSRRGLLRELLTVVAVLVAIVGGPLLIRRLETQQRGVTPLSEAIARNHWLVCPDCHDRYEHASDLLRDRIGCRRWDFYAKRHR